MSLTVFIAGASGFVGRHLTAAFCRRGYGVIAAQRQTSTQMQKYVQHKIVDGSLGSLTEAVRSTSPDIIINCVAYGVKPTDRDPDRLVALNTQLPAELAKAAASVGALGIIHLGTMSEYAVSALPLKETDRLEVSNPYGSSKAAGSTLLTDTAERLNLPSITLRCFGGYGPGEGQNRLIPTLYRKLINGEVADIGDPEMVRDFINIADIVNGVLAAAEHIEKKKCGNEILNLGTGVGVSLGHFVSTFTHMAGFDNSLLNFGAYPRRETDAAFCVADMTKARSMLELAPPIGRQQALSTYLEHLKASMLISTQK